MKKKLFVCSANKQRSKTTEDFFSEKYPDLEFLSAGTNLKVCRKEGTNPLTEDKLDWADCVYVMESRHMDLIKIQTGYKYNSKIVVLGILDSWLLFEQNGVDLSYLPIFGNFDKTLI